MASQKFFDDVPEFPDNLREASMDTISLASLRENDQATAQCLLAACKRLGFFLLDLNDDPLGRELIGVIDELFVAAKTIMNLPEGIKKQFLIDPPTSFFGFKLRGSVKTETNEPDRNETLSVGGDGLMGNTAPQPLPPAVQNYLPLFTSFLKLGQQLAATIMSLLAVQLGLPPDTFTSKQDPTRPSGTNIRMVKAYASPHSEDLRTSLIHHTDFGTITFLANVLGGLQILAPGRDPMDESAWLWVRPRPGALIVNLGDAMVQWTGGLFSSGVHRVYHAPGAQRYHDRYSLVLLVRPEREASMRSMMNDGKDEGSDLTAWEWEVEKGLAMTKNAAQITRRERAAAAA